MCDLSVMKSVNVCNYVTHISLEEFEEVQELVQYILGRLPQRVTRRHGGGAESEAKLGIE